MLWVCGICRDGGTVDAAGLNPAARKTACGFESHSRHQSQGIESSSSVKLALNSSRSRQTGKLRCPKSTNATFSYDEIVEDLRRKATLAASGDQSETSLSSHIGAEFKSNRVLIQDGRNRATVITSPGGSPGDPHIHPDFNEWFMAFGGRDGVPSRGVHTISGHFR